MTPLYPGQRSQFVKETIEQEHKSSDQLYLEKLEFRPELRKSWLNFFIVNFRVVVLMIILITALGVYSFSVLPRESNPEVKIPIALVSTVYPGASPSDVEELITKPLEAGISGLDDIDTLTSNSMNSVSMITVQFDAKANVEDSIRKLRDEVNSLTPSLPTEANEPQTIQISLDDTPIWTIALTGPQDGLTLRRYADDLKDELEKIPGVREIIVSGGDETEIEIAYDPDRLNQFGLTASDANNIIRATNLALPAGTFDGSEFVYPIRADARTATADKIAAIPLSHTDEGAIIYLKDVAAVREKAAKKSVISRLSIHGSEPQNAVTIQLVKKSGSSIVSTVDAATVATEKFVAELPTGIRYTTVTDYAELINEDFKQLTDDFILTMLLVGGILLVIVGLKEALVAGLAVPLVFFVSFGVMLITGTSLNFLSIFSLILALGLLVDDAIVVVSATKQYLKTGKFTPEEAVLLVLNDFKVVLTTTTLTTVWAFLPLLMASGIIGEFIKSIPITVTVTLISSLLIALMINHPLAAVLERLRLGRGLFRGLILAIVAIGGLFVAFSPLLIIKAVAGILAIGGISAMIRWYLRGGRVRLLTNEQMMDAEWKNDEMIKYKLKRQSSAKEDNFWRRLMHGLLKFERILPIYEKYLNLISSTKRARRRTLLITAAVFIGAVLMPVTGIVKSEFFPVAEFDTFYINIEAPIGLKLNETDKIVAEVERKLLNYREIESFSTLVGAQTGQDSFQVGSSSTHLSTIVVKLVPIKERDHKSYELTALLRQDFSDINRAQVTVADVQGGPPSGAAFQANIYGEDLQTLNKIATDLKPLLSEIEGVNNPAISLKQSPADYTFTLDPAKMELLSLNAAYVGSYLRMAISGVEATTVLRAGKEIKVEARIDPAKLPDLTSVQNLQILNFKRQPVFIKDVAKVELKPSVETITRIDQKRVVLLTAGVSGTANPQMVLSEFQNKLAQKNYVLPKDYSIDYGGQNETNTQSVVSIIQAMAVAGLLIISTLIIQFNSFKKALIVLVTIPLALIGVFYGMALARVALSFPGLIGILALFGIVVKNAIILIDKINLNIKSGIPFRDAVVDAGKSRLEAIFITSVCTILGIIPITFSNETWISLGSAIIFGLMLSTFLTLFIVPTLYLTFVKENERN